MLEQFGVPISDDLLIVVLSGLAAMLSVLVVGYPMLKADVTKKRVENIVEHRQKLLKKSKEKALGKEEAPQETVSDMIGSAFKLKKMGVSQSIRDNLQAAGYRKPNAVIYFMSLRLVLPVVLIGLTLLVLANGDTELPPAISLSIAFIVGMIGYALPATFVKNQLLKRQEEFALNFPDALDLMLVCVEGGLGIEMAVQRVAEDVAKSSAVLSEEFGLLAAELSFLGDRGQAYLNFAKRIGDKTSKTFATTLVQAEQYGTSLGEALRVLSKEMRDIRMANAEQKAASLPPKLTVPMIAFFMPTLFVVILGPAIIQAMSM